MDAFNKRANISRDDFDEEQTVGIHRSWKSIFMKDRDRSVDAVAIHTNNLIILLDKLINECPDKLARKDFERVTVPWTHNTANTCQSCSAKFYLARRKHHCRLCGNLICKECSKFLSFNVAQRLTNPAFIGTKINRFNNATSSQRTSESYGIRRQTRRFLSSFGFEAKFKTEQQLTTSQEQSLRVCSKCKKLLERRKDAMDQISTPSVFAEIYEKLCQLLTQVSNLSPSYRRMAASLNNGESMYTLDAAIQMRKKLGSLEHEIYDLTECIEKWKLHDDPNSPNATPREITLRTNIRHSAIAALQESTIEMPDLPTEEEYQRLKESHHNDRGWIPTSSDNASLTYVENDLEINPMQQQYIIIKHYLKQAAESGRLEELEMLEKNLKDIEIELKRMNLSTPRAD